MQHGESQDSLAANARIAAFLSHVPKARSRALLLDYDGTLAPFSSNPQQAYPYPEIANALNRIQCETDTRLAIVTGRRASDIPKLLNLTGLEVWGCHGLERVRPNASDQIARVDARLLAAIETASKLIAAEGLSAFAERKTASIAVHWRGREAMAESVMRSMRRIWSMIPDRDGLRFAPFESGIEIRPAMRDKGDAVRSIFSEMGPDVAMAYLGDDETDEEAFGALTRRGLNILVRQEYRPTLADTWIKPPGELLAFLSGWIAACKGNGQTGCQHQPDKVISKSEIHDNWRKQC
jgi:trehalose 6-phosphate phosphatase